MNRLEVSGTTQDGLFKSLGITPYHIFNLSTPLADQMVMMSVSFDQLVVCLRVLKINFSNHTGMHPCFKCPINSDLVQFVAQLSGDLGDTQRFAKFSEDLQEGDPSRGSFKPSAAQHFSEILFRRSFHRAEFTTNAIYLQLFLAEFGSYFKSLHGPAHK
jgi:hypothetical protein